MNFDILRREMVENQLILRGISDRRVLDAFRRVPRHEFVSEELKNSAYIDSPLPIGEGQTISQPYMVALMTECLCLRGQEKVLEIGTGSGYQAAILAELAKEVYSIERIEVLALRANQILERLGYKNIKIKTGDGTLGWPEFSPYEGIIVTAAAPQIPPPLIEQLKDGGLLVIPLNGRFSQTLTVIEKSKDRLKTQQICSCIFVPMIGKYGWKDED
jgi:protein-L-isoaspartate(D-aspartate) O-methyltransferase